VSGLATDLPDPVPVLRVRELGVSYCTAAGAIPAVAGLSLEIGAGESLCLVGESGSGKSTVARAIVRLLAPAGRMDAGSIELLGEDIASAPESRLREIRGSRAGMVFQDPSSALDPLYRAADPVVEALRAHLDLTHAQAGERTLALFGSVGLTPAEECARLYPHQMSGGMKQRVLIAAAIACGPALLIADEPTTALDATVQAQILSLLAMLARERGMALLLITHDLRLASTLGGRVAVMYAGRIVEEGPSSEVLAKPSHPYTAGLLASLPDSAAQEGGRLVAIPGAPPDLARLDTGCAFRPRCARARERCAERPALAECGGGRRVACHFPLGGGPAAARHAEASHA
jgi:peptide/nickel transport system ATP-binding protein